MSVKTFRVDWYPGAAHYDFSRLEAEEIAVLIQIINAIYIENGPIENDPDHISRSIKKMRPKKCAQIIQKLIDNGSISIQKPNRICQKMALLQLQYTSTRRVVSQKSGEKGAEKRWQNQQNQELKNGHPINSEMASTSTSTSITPYSPPEGDISSLPFFELERITQNENPRSKRYKIAKAQIDGMLKAGYDPRFENQEHENPAIENSDQSEL